MSIRSFGAALQSTPNMNYFAYPTAAERYANGRPFFHPLAIKKIGAVCCETARVNRALDVGCGTGQSTLALVEVADKIIGLDNSTEMLSHAASHAQISYVEARAEQLPFDDGTFDLVTVGLALHWFDQQQFMLEARRVLRQGGWLVIYHDGFTGRMKGNSNFEKWNREQYLSRYPPPPRNKQTFTESDAAAFGFVPSGLDEFIHEEQFTPDQLVGYLLTQTNVISAVETGSEGLQSVAQWILNSTLPLFAGPKESFLFSCQIQFFKRL